MLSQINIKILSEAEGQQVINVQVSDFGESPLMSLSLSGDFRGSGTIPADVFAMAKVLDALRETVNIFKKYKGSSMIPRCLQDISPHDFVPAILIEK